MDEIDAALDFRNVSIVANYIKVRIFLLGQQRCLRRMLPSFLPSFLPSSCQACNACVKIMLHSSLVRLAMHVSKCFILPLSGLQCMCQNNASLFPCQACNACIKIMPTLPLSDLQCMYQNNASSSPWQTCNACIKMLHPPLVRLAIHLSK